jgi:pyruvate, orthophosphate dikinase
MIAGRDATMPSGGTTDDTSAGLPVYGLDDVPVLPADELRQLLGGKAAGLVEMRRLSIPVPPGFVLGTPLCGRFLASGWPAGLEAAIDKSLAALEEATNCRFGDSHSPLLVSVRSGAPVSMPGMMDTILNLGANRATIAALAERSRDERFALDTWSRFSRMYASIVLGLAAEALGDAPACNTSAAHLQADIDRVYAVCAQRGTPIPDDPRTQLRGAIEAVFRSSRSNRAKVYRSREELAQDIRTAVVVQSMVFGNLGPLSGTGVVFSRDPSTGANEVCGDFLPGAQGEDVVSGARKSEPLAAMKRQLPHAFDELCNVVGRLERHYRDLCDVEFTVQKGQLQILQVRAGRRSAVAAVRIAVEMANSGLITREDAVRRVTREQVQQLKTSRSVRTGAMAIASGIAASPGVACGVICLHPDRVAEVAANGCNVILVRPTTSPEDVHGMEKSAGIVTSTGGMVSHAALIARGWGIAAVCGVEGLVFEPQVSIGGHVVREGDRLTIDGGSGAVYLGDCAESRDNRRVELNTLLAWAADLGIEPGSEPDDLSAAGGGRGVDPFTLMRAVALLGIAADARLAAVLAIPLDAARNALDALPPGHVSRSARGLQLTPDGKRWLQSQLAAERLRIDADRANSLYEQFTDEQFTEADTVLKRVIAGWQVREVDGRDVINDHSDADYDAAIRAMLRAVHSKAVPLIDEILALAPRLDLYRTRLARAAAAVDAGDGTMVASPFKDSYHTVWFELHEELMHLAGRDRATEEAAASGAKRQ